MGNTSDKVEALSYQTDHYKSVGDYIHGDSSSLKAFYIPSQNIGFSFHDGNLLVNQNKPQPGIQTTQVYLEKDLVQKIVAIHQLQQQVNLQKTQLLSIYRNDPMFANPSRPGIVVIDRNDPLFDQLRPGIVVENDERIE